MNRIGVVLVLVARAALAQEEDFSKVQIRATHVAGGVYMLDGVGGFAGGNIGVSVGEDGVVLIDDQFAPLAPQIQAALKGISDKPIRFVINTHFHGDHTGGNGWAGRGAPILAHDNVRTRLVAQTRTPGPDGKTIGNEALPVITFNAEATLHLNGEDIRAIHFPGGHTDGDSVIFFSASKVVHMGDDFFSGKFPFIDFKSGGSVKGMIATVEKVLAEVPPDTRIIPGHGPLSTVTDLKAFLAMLRETSALVAAGLRAGKTPAALKKERVLARWHSWSWQFIDEDAFIDELSHE